MMAACVLVAEMIDSTLPCKGLFYTQGAECKHTSSHHHCQAPSSTYANVCVCAAAPALDIGVATRDQHTARLHWLVSLACNASFLTQRCCTEAHMGKVEEGKEFERGGRQGRQPGLWQRATASNG